MSRSHLFIAIILACAACSAGGRRAGPGSCPLTSADSAYLQRGPVYRDCDVTRRARLLTTGIHPDFRPSTTPSVGGSACYTAQIEFVVDTTGIPEVRTARIVATSDPMFATAVLEILPRLRYEPAVKDSIRVRQVVTEKREMAVKVISAPAGQRPNPGRAPMC